MSASRLEIQRLQRELRGCAVTSAGRSVGNCILLNFRMPSNAHAKPGLLVELAKWEIRWCGTCSARSCSRSRTVDSALAKLVGAKIVEARISEDGIRLTFNRPFSLRVSTLTSSELGPGWDRLDQWVVFGVHSKTYQPVNGRIARE